MSKTHTASTQIEISASPEDVRSLFLDFPRHQQYAAWTLSTGNSRKEAKDLQPGDRVKVNMKGFAFSPRVLENTPRCFQWVGESWVVSGTHQFHFRPSDKNPGGTTFINTETWSGFLSKFFDGSQGKQMAANFDIFNRSFKDFVERNADAPKPDHLHEMAGDDDGDETQLETARQAYEMDAVAEADAGKRPIRYELV